MFLPKKLLTIKILITLIISTNTNCWANTEIVPIVQGEKAAFTGSLVPNSTLNLMRKDIETLDLVKKQNLELKSLGELNDIKIDFYKKENDILLKNNNLNKYENVLYFTLGVVVTGLAAKAAIEATK